jgi:hypothetical protein
VVAIGQGAHQTRARNTCCATRPLPCIPSSSCLRESSTREAGPVSISSRAHTRTQITSGTGDVGNQNDLALPVRHVANVAIDIFGRELRERRLVSRLGLCTDVPHSLDSPLDSTSSGFVCTLGCSGHRTPGNDPYKFSYCQYKREKAQIVEVYNLVEQKETSNVASALINENFPTPVLWVV